MRRIIFVILILCFTASESLAQERFSACVLEWENPATNTNGTPLTDLAGVRLLASQEQGVVGAEVIADVATSEPGATVQTACTFPTESAWFVVAVAYDDATPPNVSAPSNEFALIWDQTAPSTVVLRLSAMLQLQIQVQTP